MARGDRLATLGREIDQPKLDLQRDVVRNERRQTVENRPYGKVELRMPELMYPESHPYHHPVIGSHADLAAASVRDVQRFFEEHYVPANAALVVAGDVRANEVNEIAGRYFGVIASAPPPSSPGAAKPAPLPVPKLDKVVRETIEDKVEMTKIIMAFHSPAHFEPGDAELDLLASILSSGKTSRLYKSLVYEKALAQSVAALQESALLSSMFTVEIMVRPGVSVDLVEKRRTRLLADVIAKPPTDEELKRAKNQIGFDFRPAPVDCVAGTTSQHVLGREGRSRFREQGPRALQPGRPPRGVFAQAQKTITLGGRVIMRVVPEGGPKGKTRDKRPGKPK